MVTVVDADSLLHQLEEQEGAQGREVGGNGGGGGGGGMLVSMKRQLENADVILLNKTDLVDHQGYVRLCVFLFPFLGPRFCYSHPRLVCRYPPQQYEPLPSLI